MSHEEEAETDLPRVLVVDDTEANLMALDAVLEGLPCDVVHARSGEQALQRLLQQPFAVMLLDVEMPGMNGFEVARLARGSSVGRAVPILFLTAAEASDDLSLRGYASGAVDLLTKPINPDILRGKVTIFLELFDSRRKLASTVATLQRTNTRLLMLAHDEAAATERLRAQNEELHRAHDALRSLQARLLQAARVATVGELVASICYEINDPLAFTASHLATVSAQLARIDDAVGQTFSPEVALQWVKTRSRTAEAAAGLERIARVMKKLQLMARPEESGPRRVCVVECVDAALAVIRRRVAGRIAVEVAVASDEEIECCAGLVCQLILNVLSSAIDGLHGCGLISICGERREQCYVLTVDADADKEASARPPELAAANDEPFGNDEESSVVVQLAAKLGGTVRVNRPRKGNAVVELTIPLRPPQR